MRLNKRIQNGLTNQRCLQTALCSLSLMNHCNFIMALRNTWCSLFFYHHTDLVLDSFRCEKIRGKLIDKVLREAADALKYLSRVLQRDLISHYLFKLCKCLVTHIPSSQVLLRKDSASPDFLAARRKIFGHTLQTLSGNDVVSQPSPDMCTFKTKEVLLGLQGSKDVHDSKLEAGHWLERWGSCQCPLLAI